MPVLGLDERVEAVSQLVRDGESWKLGSLLVTAYHTPCHTTGSCCYHVADTVTGEHAVFTGDTVFTGPSSTAGGGGARRGPRRSA